MMVVVVEVVEVNVTLVMALLCQMSCQIAPLF